jgi:hypothetical protein
MNYLKFTLFLSFGLLAQALVLPEESQDALAEQARLFGMLTDFYNNLIAAPVNSLVSSLAGMAVLVTAGIADQGLGKRGAIWDGIVDGIQQVGLTLTQILLQLQISEGQGGKRDAKDLLSDIVGQLSAAAMAQVNILVQQLGLSLTQILLQISAGGNGLGKRGAIWDGIVQGFRPIVDQGVQQIGLTLTQILLQISQGKRDAKDLLSDIVGQLSAAAMAQANILVQQLGLSLTQILLQISSGVNGGKRDAKGFISDLSSQLVTSINNALVKPGALLVSQALLHIMDNGILPTIGKRDLLIQ